MSLIRTLLASDSQNLPPMFSIRRWPGEGLSRIAEGCFPLVLVPLPFKKEGTVIHTWGQRRQLTHEAPARRSRIPLALFWVPVHELALAVVEFALSVVLRNLLSPLSLVFLS